MVNSFLRISVLRQHRVVHVRRCGRASSAYIAVLCERHGKADRARQGRAGHIHKIRRRAHSINDPGTNGAATRLSDTTGWNRRRTTRMLWLRLAD